MVIDAAATTASVIASGASLRVEVSMNLSEAKTIGITAVAAAAVALVTVMVYEGHTSVSGGEHAVTVQPGTTVAVRSGDEPRLEAFERGLAAQKARIAELEAKLVKATAERDQAVKAAGTPTPPPPPPNKTVVVRKNVRDDVIDNPFLPPRTLCSDTAAVAQLEQKADAQLGAGMFGAALASFEQVLKCKPAVLIKTYLAACRSKNFPKAKAYFRQFSAQRQDPLAQICMKEGFDPRME